MCNRYRVSAKHYELAKRFGFDVSKLHPEPGRLPLPELFPKRIGWVVRKEAGERVLDVMKGPPVTNVRNLSSPFWRSALVRPDRRCLVPVTDFCEWGAEPDPETKRKPEHWFSLADDPLFAFAGIWRPVGEAEGPEGKAFAFLTCGYLGEPTGHVVGAIHAKAMPVILHREDEDRWQDAETNDACSLAAAFPSQLMRAG